MRTLCLCILAIAFLAPAQEAPAHFLIECELPAGVDVTHLTQPQMATFQQHGAYLSKLRDQGIVIVGGHTDNLQHIRAIIIVKANDAAAARTLATDDPAVKAGLLKFSVEPFVGQALSPANPCFSNAARRSLSELPAPCLRAPGAQHPTQSACRMHARSKDR